MCESIHNQIWFIPWWDHVNHVFFCIVLLDCWVVAEVPMLLLPSTASATTIVATGSETTSSSASIADMLDIWNVLMVKVCETNAGINPMERVW